MSEVRLVIREANRDWSGTIHGSSADQAVAALSADPVTIEELEIATERFAKRSPKHGFFTNLSPGTSAEPYDAGLVVIDLVARLVVVDSTYSSPGLSGTVNYHNGRHGTNKQLRYHLADDWLFAHDGDQWMHVAEERRRQRAMKPIRDDRQVFYGRPLLEFIARQCHAAFARRDQIAAAVRAARAGDAGIRSEDETIVSPDHADATSATRHGVTPSAWPGDDRFASPFYDTLMRIHAAWMLTPRDDLDGACPREVALERHGHLMSDLEDRCQQWSLMDECPRGLDESAHAFRFGGFGTHELVKYYDLVRDLLWSCWEGLDVPAHSPRAGSFPESITVGDFLTTEIPRLERIREELLDTPDHEFDGRTPRSIIDRERARLPEGGAGQDVIIDPDSPCSQMLGDLSGPMFWHLDGSGMDDHFAFDMDSRTREEWDDERLGWDEHDQDFQAERSERGSLGATDDSTSPNDGSPSIWSRSFLAETTADTPLAIRVFGISVHLAELIDDLRAGADRESTAPGAQRQIDRLNRDFGNLRELLHGSDSSLAEALIDPVLCRFADSLETIATDRPELALKCESLSKEVRRLLDPPDAESDGEFDDPDDSF